MKIEMSSAEMETNSNLMHLLFGTPKTIFEKDDKGNVNLKLAPKEEWDNYYNSRAEIMLGYNDIDKLKTWDSYKDEIKSQYPKCGSSIQTDVNGQNWLIIAGTGFCKMWTVGEWKPE